MFNSKKGFTLAEVLITLTVIGVVASISIPNLMNNINDAQNKAAWKKSWAEITQAYMNIKREEGGSLNTYFGTSLYQSAPLQNKFWTQFNRLQEDNGVLRSDLYNNVLVYKSLAGNASAGDNFCQANFVAGNGVDFYFRNYDPNYALIWVDVNGYSKGPNTMGKDLFGAVYNKDWLKPMGASGTGLTDTCSQTEVTCPHTTGFHFGSNCAGAGCSAKYIYE